MGVSLGRTQSALVASKSRNVAVGLGCTALFLLPFGAVGLGATLIGLQRLIRGNQHDAWLLLLFGLVFGGTAAAGWSLLLVGRRKLQEQEKLQARYPDQPWMWRTDWAGARISDSGRSTMWGSWMFSALWNLIGFPTGYLSLRAAQQDGNPKAYIGLLFPLVGCGLLSWAIQNTLRHRKYGVSVLELATLPGTIGHRLAGQVRTSAVLQSNKDFVVTLSCINRVTTGSGNNQSTTERILWQDEQRVRGEASRDSTGMFTRIPIGFRVPSDVRSTDPTQPNDQILWRLGISADVPGVDYASTFEVPVFRTPESDLPPSDEDVRLAQAESVPYRQPRDSRVLVSRNPRGMEISFPPARAPGAALGLTFFAILWGGIVLLLIHLKAPLLFPLVFGLFELLLVVGTFQLWLSVTRVVVQRGSLTIAQGYLVARSERSVNVGDIAEISTRIDMQMGTRPYYDIVVLTRSGKRIAAGRWLRDKHEAEWLAATIKEGVGLEPIGPAEPDSRMPQSSPGSSPRHAR